MVATELAESVEGSFAKQEANKELLLSELDVEKTSNRSEPKEQTNTEPDLDF